MMTQECKIHYMTLASNLCGFQISEAQLDLLVTIYEGIIKKEGDFSVRDAAEIKSEVETREQERVIEKKEREIRASQKQFKPSENESAMDNTL